MLVWIYNVRKTLALRIVEDVVKRVTQWNCLVNDVLSYMVIIGRLTARALPLLAIFSRTVCYADSNILDFSQAN